MIRVVIFYTSVYLVDHRESMKTSTRYKSDSYELLAASGCCSRVVVTCSVNSREILKLHNSLFRTAHPQFEVMMTSEMLEKRRTSGRMLLQ